MEHPQPGSNDKGVLSEKGFVQSAMRLDSLARSKFTGRPKVVFWGSLSRAVLYLFWEPRNWIGFSTSRMPDNWGAFVAAKGLHREPNLARAVAFTHGRSIGMALQRCRCYQYILHSWELS